MDIQSIRPDLSDEQAREVLQYADNKHDANEGINWLTLRIYADALYSEPEDLEQYRTEDE